MNATICRALVAAAIAVCAAPAATPAIAETTGTTDVTIQVSNEDGNIAWSAPTVVPMKATAAGTLIGPGADALSIKNLSAFPIRVKTMDAQAADPFHLVADVDKSTGDNDFQMSVNGVAATPAVELADDGTWAMGYAGNADGTDMLPLTVSAAKIARVTEDLSQAKKAATVTWTVEPTEYVKPEPKPDANGVAFAVYSADDKSLDLYKRDRKPEIGDTFNGKTVTESFDLDESDSYSTKSWPWKNPFSDKATKATETVEVVDSGIKPYSTEQWFNSFDKLENVYVAKLDTSNLVNMGQMFAACSSLTGLDLSNWDTSSAVDADGMFQYCSKLTNLDSIANWDTSNLDNLNSLFWNCKSLTSLDLSNWNTSGVKKMVETFAGCNALTTLDLSGWDVSNVTLMYSMFGSNYQYNYDLMNLEEIKGISSWDTSNVTDMSSMFNGCHKLTSLDLSGWNTSKVTGMASMFEYCSSLTSLDLSSWNTSKVTGMVDMFTNCASLATVGDLSGWNTSKITSMESMFSGCKSLTSLDLSGWDTSNVDNMCNMFQNCSKLTTVGDLSGWDVSNVTVMRYIFSGCSSLHLDCSAWTMNDYVADGPFNDDAPGVIPPNWPWLRPTK